MKSKRVELFASSELDFLETQMNNWISENGNCSVIDVRFTANCVPSERVDIDEPMFDIIYTAVIFYEVEG